mgnify:FL=1
MDKKSKEFDRKLLDGLIGKSFPIATFEEELEMYFKAKSSKKLWYSSAPDRICTDDGQYHDVNFRCCPESDNAKYLFCFCLEHINGQVMIKKGYLNPI